MGDFRLERLRRGRHWLAHILVAAFLLPLVLGLLPQPALSAAAALDRDLAWSICDPAGPPGDGKQHEQQHDATCILCATGCPVCAPALAADAAAIPAQRATAQSTPPIPKAPLRSVLRVLRDGNPTRGPPLS